MGGRAKRLKVEGLGPTEAQAVRYRYEFDSVRDGTHLVGRAYRREPWFVTLFRRGDIDGDQLAALRYYRDAHENADRSETRCALNREPGGGGDTATLRLMMARETRDDCEAAIPAFLIDTLRAVAIDDKDYTEVARDRYGSGRKRDERGIVRLQPPSSRQRKRIATEFKTAAYQLHAFVAPRISTSDGRTAHG